MFITERAKIFIKAMLSEEQIKEFQAIYKYYYGKDISRDEASRSGSQLIRLIQLIYIPMTKEEFQMVQHQRTEISNVLSNENEIQFRR